MKKALKTKCYAFSCHIYPLFESGYNLASDIYQKLNLNAVLESHVYGDNGSSSSYVSFSFVGSKIIISLDIPLDDGGYRVDIRRKESRVHYFKTLSEAVNFINNIDAYIILIDQEIEKKLIERARPILFDSKLIKDALILSEKDILSIHCDFTREHCLAYLRKLNSHFLSIHQDEFCLQDTIQESSFIAESRFGELEKRFLTPSLHSFSKNLKNLVNM